MKRGCFFIAAFALCANLAISIPAQDPVPPPVAEASLRSAAELDTMFGPIALYPDPLIAQLLPAAIQSSEIVVADRYLATGGDPNQIDAQPWSASVKAMAHYPEVLKWMDDNLDWTTQVGQAFLDQPEDVMNAIQRLRAQAQALGNLQSTPQQTVTVDDGDIEIVPANPEIIYVPVYQPEIVYARRPIFGAGSYISFGAGFSIGLWLNHDWDWRNHRVVVWDQNHFRPRDWWYHPGPERFRAGAPHQDFHVWRPRETRGRPIVTREDRGWDVRTRPPEQPRNNENRPRAVEPSRRVESPRQPEPSRPPPSRIENHRPEPRVEQPPPRVAPPAPHSAPEIQRPSPPPPRSAAPASPNGALLGARNARDARDFSNRGQQSRQIQNSPPPSRGAPASPPGRQPNNDHPGRH